MSEKSQKSSSRTELQILEAVAVNFPRDMKVSDLATVTGLSRQTVYDVAKKLVAKGLLKVGESKGVTEFGVNSSVYMQIIGKVEHVEEIFDMNESKIDAIEVPVSGYGYGEPLFCNTLLIGRKLYSSTIQIKPVLRSQIGLIKRLEATIESIHSLQRTYWTISDVYDVKFDHPTCEIGVGSLSFLRTLMTYDQAAFKVLFSVYDELGCILYHLEGRVGEGFADRLVMTILLPKIPITKEFAIDWLSTGRLKYVDEARSKITEKLSEKPVEIPSSQILAIVSDPRKMNRPVREAVVEISTSEASSLGLGFNKILASSFDSSVDRSLKERCPLNLWIGQCRVTPGENEPIGSTILLYGGSLTCELF